MTSKNEKNLIKSLRIKFIAVIMSSVALVLVVAFATICWLDYNQSVSSVYKTLEDSITSSNTYRTYLLGGNTSNYLFMRHGDVFAYSLSSTIPDNSSSSSNSDSSSDSSANNSSSSDDPSGSSSLGSEDSSLIPFDNKRENSANENSDTQDSSAQDDSTFAPPSIGSHADTSSIPVALYMQTSLTQTPIVTADTTAIIEDSTLSTAMASAQSATQNSGLLSDVGLFYSKKELSDGTLFVAFADESAVSDWQYLARTLGVVGVIVLAIFFVIAWLLSRWALKPVETAWEQQQQFIADASHEMKTPLTVILANAAIALKKPQATIAEQSQWIEGIQDEAQNMEHLVLDMLVLAQPESAVSQTESSAETVNLSDVAERGALQFEAVAFERGIMVDTEVERNITLKGNPASLQRMVGTLIDNACKYAPANSTILVSLKKTGTALELSVHNWGDPIPAEDLPHLFDRFYRADKSRDRRTEEGTHSFGLGLAIAQKIAGQHGGQLSATSTAEAGTTFTARFPL